MTDPFGVTLQIEGTDADDGHVRLDVLLSELQTVKGIVRAAEDESGGPGRVAVQVVDLRHSSPATVALRLVNLKQGPDIRPRIMESLRNARRAIDDASQIAQIPVKMAELVSQLVQPVSKGLSPRVTLTVADEAATVTEERAKQITLAMATAEEAEGSFTGLLQAINLHAAEPTFTIYPLRGPKSLKCHFPKELRQRAIEAIDKRVEVEGTLRYRTRARFPHEISAQMINVLPAGDELPTWDDLRGAIPDATGGETSEEYIRRLRDEW